MREPSRAAAGSREPGAKPGCCREPGAKPGCCREPGAGSREPGAGSQAGLLDKEEEDDFYKTTYGGFNEEGDDDEVDSDFSMDENDEVKSDGVQTKAYKEPARKKVTDGSKTKSSASHKQKNRPAPRTLGIQDFGRRLGTSMAAAAVILAASLAGVNFYQDQLLQAIQAFLPEAKELAKQYGPALVTTIITWFSTEASVFSVVVPIVPETQPVSQDTKMSDIKDAKRCIAYKNVDVGKFDEEADRIGRILNLDKDTTEEIKGAKYADSIVNAMEDFSHGPVGFYYFGKYTTLRRSNGNMDMSIILYSIKWNLVDSYKVDVETNEVREILVRSQAMTIKEKDIWMDELRSQAVKGFQGICPSNFFTVVKEEASTTSNPAVKDEDMKIEIEKVLKYLKIHAVEEVVD